MVVVTNDSETNIDLDIVDTFWHYHNFYVVGYKKIESVIPNWRWYNIRIPLPVVAKMAPFDCD